MAVLDLGAPVNTALLLFILYQAQRILLPPVSSPASASNPPPGEYKSAYTWMPKSHPQALLWKRYTPHTLVEFDGQNGKRILLAIKGKVFDVTAGRNFYGPDGPYGNFAGRDASRGMAKQSFDVEMLTPLDQPLDKLEDLNRMEIENMNGWIEHFTHKYVVCGELVENDAA